MPGTGRKTTAVGFDQARVLIVEDEPFIALDLVSTVEDACGVPVGPAGTVKQALAYVEANDIRAAILDVSLPDGHIGPVIEALSDHDTVMIVHTGRGLPAEIRARFPHVPVFMNPTPSAVLVQKLAVELHG